MVTDVYRPLKPGISGGHSTFVAVDAAECHEVPQEIRRVFFCYSSSRNVDVSTTIYIYRYDDI